MQVTSSGAEHFWRPLRLYELTVCVPHRDTSGQRREMVVGTGFEPVERFLQACVACVASVSGETADTQLRTQKLGELREVIEAWPKLSGELPAAVLAVTRTVKR